MSRVASLLLVAVLLLGLVIAIDPQARARADAFVHDLTPNRDEKVVDDAPTVSQDDETSVSTPFVTPAPYIQDTDTEDSSDEPIIVVNWDALRDSLRNLWDRLKNITITADFQTDSK